MSQVFQNGHALLVGVGADLPGTVADATAIRDVLCNPKRGAYPDAQVKLVTQEKATAAGILKELDDLIESSNKDAAATVFVYYSGHGGRLAVPNEEPTYFFKPFGYKPGDEHESTALFGEDFSDRLAKISAQKLIVFLDCCKAAGIPKDEPKSNFEPSPLIPNIDRLTSGSGRIIVTSCQENESSYIGKGLSVFTEVLVEALQGQGTFADDGFARILPVTSYLLREVPTRALPEAQHPILNKAERLTEDFELCFYAGGAKGVPAIGATPPSIPSVLDELRRRQIGGIRNNYASQIKLLEQFREARAMETNVKSLARLDKDIEDANATIAEYGEEIAKLEQSLN